MYRSLQQVFLLIRNTFTGKQARPNPSGAALRRSVELLEHPHYHNSSCEMCRDR